MEKRNIAVCIILSFVTCGIYSLYWFYCIASDIYKANGEENKAGMDLVLGIVTCSIYMIYKYYVYGKILDDIRQRNGIAPKNDSIMFVILGIFGLSLVNECILQHNLNEEIGPLLSGYNPQGPYGPQGPQNYN